MCHSISSCHWFLELDNSCNFLDQGFPFDPKSSESVNRYDHMYVVVEINNMEMMVDLRQLPCQLIRLLSYPINIGHIPALRR